MKKFGNNQEQFIRMREKTDNYNKIFKNIAILCKMLYNINATFRVLKQCLNHKL